MKLRGASKKAVIATAGFTLISEALYLHKPYLALPMQGQFEQELNAFQLESLGYGKNVTEVSAEAIGDFRFDTPSGKEFKRFLSFGIGVHHAGMPSAVYRCGLPCSPGAGTGAAGGSLKCSARSSTARRNVSAPPAVVSSSR